MIQKVKGTKDYYKDSMLLKEIVSKSIRDYLSVSGYSRIETPILEYSELFKRSVEDSDIANKEMYEFKDKSDRDICLRPEGTASFVRFLIENKLHVSNPMQKYYYEGPMFRYEQPQKGRLRQFTQIGVENISEKNLYTDIETIQSAIRSIERAFFDLNQSRFQLTVHINTIGSKEDRAKYEEVLYNFLLPYKDQLSEISQKRLEEKKVLRILDDKVDSKLPFMKKAPLIKDYISKESYEHLGKIVEYLDQYTEAKIVEDKVLVRGLDYYDDIVFEIHASTRARESLVVCGGGRYSNLINQLGGSNISSIGFAIGVDRILALSSFNEPDFLDYLENFEEGIYLCVPEEANKLPNAADIREEFLKGAEIFKDLFLSNSGKMEVNFRAYSETGLVKDKKIFARAKSMKMRYVLTYDVKKHVFVFVDLKNNKKFKMDNLCEAPELEDIFEKLRNEPMELEDIFEAVEKTGMMKVLSYILDELQYEDCSGDLYDDEDEDFEDEDE
ncbi:histidine--tRNA ligase [Mycoplasmopsis ciconiae]|uniref:Histidine--tRNA ligase n=1 Tax=Mycoplasmopsis ciconiae TaxID=561067 RepID=A0ABU7MMW2_9BACT|nr:histidine--tRNA ligase [Mycoplasmopsis ciconiae]